MSLLLDILLASIMCAFIENTIFIKGIGTSTLLVVSKNPKQILSFCLSITYMNIVSTVLMYFSEKLIPYGELSYVYQPLVFVIIIGFVYIITLVLMWRFFDKMFLKFKKFIHLSAFNCIVLGTLFIARQQGGTLLEYIGYAFGVGLGFLIATIIVSINNEKLNSECIPRSFRGYPVTLIYIGIISMLIYVLM